MVKTFRVLIAALIAMAGIVGLASSAGAQGVGTQTYVSVPTGAIVSEITSLGSEFGVTDPSTCQQGSPRMVIGVDSDDDGVEDAYIHGFMGPAADVNNCAFADGSNLLEVGVFEFTVLGEVGNYVGWDQVVAVAGELPITSVFLTDESSTFSAAAVTNPTPYATFSTVIAPTGANVTFSVLEGTTPVADATVVVYLDGVALDNGNTNSEGILGWGMLEADAYTYTVNKDGYTEASGSFTVVAGEDQTVTVQLTAVEAPTETETETATETETETATETETETDTATETETKADAPVAVTSLPSTGSGPASDGPAMLMAAAGAAALLAGAGIFRSRR